MQDKLTTGFQIPGRTDHAVKWADAGQLMSVFCSDTRYGRMQGIELYKRLLPPLSSGQYAIAHKKIDSEILGNNLDAPVAAVLWARVSDKVHETLMSKQDIPFLLVNEWDSGANHWIIDTAGDIKTCGQLIDKLHREQFGNRPFHAFMNFGEGKVNVRSFGV